MRASPLDLLGSSDLVEHLEAVSAQLATTCTVGSIGKFAPLTVMAVPSRQRPPKPRSCLGGPLTYFIDAPRQIVANLDWPESKHVPAELEQALTL